MTECQKRLLDIGLSINKRSANQRIKKKKKTEYYKPFCLAFVDYEKVFDWVEHTTDFNSM